jgi:hypothetical protein
MPTSVFAAYEQQHYPYRFAGTLHLNSIAGGVPRDPAVLEGHLKRKTAEPDDLIRQEIANVMAERALRGEADGDIAVAIEDAIGEVAVTKGLVGFRTDPEHGLWIRSAQLKACIREAGSIAAAAGKIKQAGWGLNSAQRGLLKWLAEHVFVVDDRLYLGVTEPTYTEQSFIHKMTPKGPTSAIQYTEVVENAKLDFTVETDWEFPEADWAAIWLTAEQNGLGASRKMGYGTFTVTKWERLG